MVANALNRNGCNNVRNVLRIAFRFAPNSINGVATAETNNLIVPSTSEFIGSTWLLEGAKKMYPINIEHTGPLSFLPNLVLAPTYAPRQAQVDRDTVVRRYSVKTVVVDARICMLNFFFLVPLLLVARSLVTGRLPEDSNIDTLLDDVVNSTTVSSLLHERRLFCAIWCNFVSECIFFVLFSTFKKKLQSNNAHTQTRTHVVRTNSHVFNCIFIFATPVRLPIQVRVLRWQRST